jgi:protein tyrosine phosphatase (PTP) superfamily phosphohydrolase (DUF442 family)
MIAASRRHHPPALLIVAALLALIAALFLPVGEADAEQARLKKVWLSSMRNAHELNDIYLGGSVSPASIKKARDKNGVRTIVNLRLPGEQIDWDEGHTCRRYGIVYYNPGFRAPSTLSDRLLEMLREFLADPNKRPILMHDSSGQRTGAVWLAYRTLDDGLPFAEALKEAQSLGLKKGELEDRVREYISDVQTGSLRKGSIR